MPSKNSLSTLKTKEKDETPILNTKKTTAKRINKGFQVEIERAKKWDLLVAQMKGESKNKKETGPQLLDEALDYLFNKYLVNQ